MNELKILSAALFCFSFLQLSVASAETMSKSDYSAAQTRISANYALDKEACNALAGNNKDICVEQAKAKEDVARAELEYKQTGSSADHNKLLVIKAKSAYSVSKERCDDLSGNAKDVCIKEAQAVERKALANVNMSKEIEDAKKDAATEIVDADYKVAIEKCDALAGAAKSGCIEAAKNKFRKN